MKTLMLFLLASASAALTSPVRGQASDGPGKVEAVRCFYFQPEVTWGIATLEIQAALGKNSQSLYSINGVLFPLAPRVLYRMKREARVPLRQELRLTLSEGLDKKQIENWVYAYSPEAVTVGVGPSVKVKDVALIAAILHQEKINILLFDITSGGHDVVLSVDTTGPRIQK